MNLTIAILLNYYCLNYCCEIYFESHSFARNYFLFVYVMIRIFR